MRNPVGLAWERLVDRLTRAEEEYARLSRIEGRAALKALPRMNRLSDEIESLKRRIAVAESLLEESK